MAVPSRVERHDVVERKLTRRSYGVYVSVEPEYGKTIREVADILGLSLSEAGNEAFAMWLVARRKELAARLDPGK